MKLVVPVVRLSLHALLALTELMLTIIGLLCFAAGTEKRANFQSTSIQPGITNYRTLRLDDGTDPYGWYD